LTKFWRLSVAEEQDVVGCGATVTSRSGEVKEVN